MKVLDEFDIVINTLQKQHDVLWRMTEQNMNSEFGMSLLDDIRLNRWINYNKQLICGRLENDSSNISAGISICR
jgi:hypothetical protein